MFIMVDLPLPLGPMIARYSLRRIFSETPRNAWIVSLPISYFLVTFSISITSAPGGRVTRGAGGGVRRCRFDQRDGINHGKWLLEDKPDGSDHHGAAFSKATLEPSFNSRVIAR